MRVMVLALLSMAVGCWPQGGDEPEGELVGQFEVVGVMVEQSCGAGIPAEDPLELSFEVRLEDNGRAFYRLTTGATFAGTEADGRYTFQVSQTWTVLEPDPFRGFAGCSVTQRDVLSMTIEEPSAEPMMDGGVAENEDGGELVADPTLVTLTGWQSTDIIPLAGSDCRPAVAALGGSFLALPCRVEYVLTGNGI
jgi:hypothetical protein